MKIRIIRRLRNTLWLYNIARSFFSDKLVIESPEGGAVIKIEQIKGKGNKVVYGCNCKINFLSLKIRGNNNFICIGNNCKIKSHVQFYLHGDNGKIELGDDCSINSNALIQADEGQSIILGNDCMLSNHVSMRTSDNHPIYEQGSEKRINNPKSIVIGGHVWIGAGVTVLKGVTIGDGSVIGMNSIVTHDVPPHSIATGCPTKIVKTGIEWKREL